MSSPPERRIALVVLATGAVAFAVLAVLLVPWDPVPGGTPPPAAPSSVFTAAQVDRAEEYSGLTRQLAWASLAVSLAVACWFGFTRHGRRLVGRLRGPWWWRVLLAVAVLDLLGRLATLPFAVLVRRRQLDYGLSRQSWGGFAADLLRGEAVTLVTTALGVLLVVACARRWRRAWPAVAGGILALLVLAGSFVYPLVVEPLFNDFRSLPAGALRSGVLRLADEEHVHVDDVLVADASRRTTTLNAYVSGFGSTRRVVLYDNLVDDLPERQVLSVVAHELAHARHQDVVTGSLLGAAGALVGMGLLGVIVGALDERRRSREPDPGAGSRSGAGDPAVVPLLLALLALGTVAAAPVQNAVSRRIETRADVDALRATADPQAFISMQHKLAVRSLADPTPPAWSQWWFGTHPTGLTRIAIARQLDGTSG